MRSNSLGRLVILLVAALLSGSVIGCGQQTKDAAVDDGSAPIANASPASHDHSGWWCVEHAVPEEECSLCSSKAAAEFKARGDWCDEHNRAQSQCFRCDPSKADKFAKLYEAKYGHPPAEATQ